MKKSRALLSNSGNLTSQLTAVEQYNNKFLILLAKEESDRYSVHLASKAQTYLLSY